MSRTEAVKKGKALVEEIRSTSIPKGRAGIWWLGQATFCFKFGETIVYVDPFYRAEHHPLRTLAESPLYASEFSNASIICCTHEHIDHLDPETMPGAIKASPHAKVVLPKWTVEQAVEMGIPRERMVMMRGDDAVELHGVKIHAIPTAHETLDYDSHLGHRYLGYVFEANGVKIYHTGDVQPYPGWYERVKTFEPYDAVFLPISAVDNLHWSQAVYFCALHRPKIAAPMHYGMVPNYTEDPAKFTDAIGRNCPEQKTRVMKIGEFWLV
ncbi:MAG: MBL fold metallo-hydrolase [Planctomycetota bacterium]